MNSRVLSSGSKHCCRVDRIFEAQADGAYKQALSKLSPIASSSCKNLGGSRNGVQPFVAISEPMLADTFSGVETFPGFHLRVPEAEI